jgi:hypothetical protein
MAVGLHQSWLERTQGRRRPRYDNGTFQASPPIAEQAEHTGTGR